MSTTAPAPGPAPRHPLGLPAGSVRALLALGVLGLSWAIAVKIGHGKLPLVFVYIQALLILALAGYFAAHGETIGHRVSYHSPLGLPRGSVRFILLAGYVGMAVFLYLQHPEFEYPATDEDWIVLLLLTGGFFVGYIVSRIIQTAAGGVEPFWYQDVQAWVAILALMCLTILVIVHIFINPSLKAWDLRLPKVESFLAAFVGFYFGSRA